MAAPPPPLAPEDLEAIAVSRRSFAHRPFDRDTQFVEDALAWLSAERADGRLTEGAPVTLVLHNFLPTATRKGPAVDIANGGVMPGDIYLCNEALNRSCVLHREDAASLNTVAAHQVALAKHQQHAETSVCFNPATGRAYIRLACLRLAAPVEITLAGALASTWSQHGLAALSGWLDAFHAGMTRSDGIGRLFFDGGAPRARLRIYYRNAIYLFLKFEVGVRLSTGYSVTPTRGVVVVRSAGEAVGITAICPGRADPLAARAVMDRSLAAAGARLSRDSIATHITCMDCPLGHDPGEECAATPLSLRHRHVVAA